MISFALSGRMNEHASVGSRCSVVCLSSLLTIGCGHAAVAHDPMVVHHDHGKEIGTVESLGAVRRYVRRLDRARKSRSTPRVDAATSYWFGVDGGWPFRKDPRIEANSDDVPGLAKAVGDDLLALRCGRIATLDVDRATATAMEDDKRLRWTGLLASDQTLVALGRMQTRRFTPSAPEFVRTFSIDGAGNPRPQSTIELRTGGTTALAAGQTRIVGDTLVLIRHMHLDHGRSLRMPAVRTHGTARGSRWRPLLTENDVQRPVMNGGVLHMAIRCTLADIESSCTAHAIMGDMAIVKHYDGASYLWMMEQAAGPERERPNAAIVRLPHDGSPATAVRVPGMPLRGATWRAREDGSLDAVIGIPHRSGAPGQDLALLRVDATAMHEGLSHRIAVDLGPVRSMHGNESMPQAFVGNTLVWADHRAGQCEDPTTIRAHGLDDGLVQELQVPGCIDLIEGSPSAMMLADWTTAKRAARLWPATLVPSLQHGVGLEVPGAMMGTSGTAWPVRIPYDGEELWAMVLRPRALRSEVKAVLFSQAGLELRERSVSRRTAVTHAPMAECDDWFEPTRVYGYRQQVIATLPAQWSVVELVDPPRVEAIDP